MKTKILEDRLNDTKVRIEEDDKKVSIYFTNGNSNAIAVDTSEAGLLILYKLLDKWFKS